MFINSNFSESLADLVVSEIPTLAKSELAARISANIVSPRVVSLSRKNFDLVQSFVQTIYKLRENRTYQQEVLSQSRQFEMQMANPGNHSILNCYDFHIGLDGLPRLIEINTNAACLAVGHFVYQVHGLKNPVADFHLTEICENILTEMSEFQNDLQNKNKGGTKQHGQSGKGNIVIIDDQPSQQNLYFEFLIYKELFKKFGFQCEIKDFREDLSSFDFIYNRTVDFYFRGSDYQRLRKYFENHEKCISPSPFEYLLLADKERMVGLSQRDFLSRFISDPSAIETVLSIIPKTLLMKDADLSEIWKNRKTLFFKPKNSYGSKQVYRGQKIARNMFDKIAHEDFIAQEYVEAPEIIFETPEGPKPFKYDFRFYTYKDRVQMVLARVYQGQVTNLQTQYGGFAPVVIR